MKDWNKITAEELQDLHKSMSDSQIAEYFNITIGKVRYKRNKYGITFKNDFYNSFVDQNSELFQKMNIGSKERLLGTDLDVLAKVLTHYIFRNGPIEDMHANGQLSQNDMKILNKFMVNKLAGLIHKMRNNEWLQIELLFGYFKFYGTDWDKAVPDTKDFEISWESYKDEVQNRLFGDSKFG